MIERPTAWPDGQKLGGVNGYPPQWHQWARECEVKYVARQMLSAKKENRRAVHAQWVEKIPHATPERVREVWDEVAEEMRKQLTRAI
jgi:predicted nucleotidyltransferase component of viral defense system